MAEKIIELILSTIVSVFIIAVFLQINLLGTSDLLFKISLVIIAIAIVVSAIAKILNYF